MVSREIRFGAVVALVVGIAAVAGPFDSSSAARPTTRVAIPFEGADSGPVLSDDGLIAVFANTDSDGTSRTMVHDRRAGSTTEIPGSDGALNPGLSGDGCMIAWSVADVATPPTTLPPPPATDPPATDPPTPTSTASTTTPTSLPPPPETDPLAPTSTASPAVAGTVAASPLRAPIPPAQSWRLMVADRCGGGSPVELEPDLRPEALGRPALSLTGDVIVVSNGLAVFRFDRTSEGYAQGTVAAPPEQPSARYGPTVDVSSDGSVVVYAAGLDPADPRSLTVYRTDPAGGPATVVSASAHRPSISGDGSIVAYARVESSRMVERSIVEIREDGAAAIVLDPGSAPQISADGNHVVYENGKAIRITSWTGDGPAAFSDTSTVALKGPVAPTATGPAIDGLGATVATDTTIPGDIEITALPAVAAFDEATYVVGRPSAGAPVTAQLTFTNAGPASVGVASIAATAPLTVSGDGCSPVVRPESSCIVEVTLPAGASGSAVATVTLTPIGIFPVPITAEVRVDVTQPPVTTQPPTTRPGTGGFPSTGTGRGGSTSSYPRYPSSSSSFPSSSSTSSSSSSSSSSSASSSVGVAFVPQVVIFPATPADSGPSTQIVELVNSSASSIEVVEVRRAPVEATAFQIESTTCTGALLIPSGRCRVTVAYTPVIDGPETAQLFATLGNGDEVTASLQAEGAVPPTLTVSPDMATTSQVVTISGSGFSPDATLELDWAGSVRDVEVGVDGTFTVPVVVPASEWTGPLTVSVGAPGAEDDDITATMLVTSATGRNPSGVLDGLGPHVGG